MKATKAWQEQRCQVALADGKPNNPGSSRDTAAARVTDISPQAPPAWAAALDTSVFRDTVTRLASVMAEVNIDSAWEQQDPSGGDVALSLGEDPSGGISRTLTNAEVRMDLPNWAQPMLDEVESLVEKEAIRRLSSVEARLWLRDHPLAQIYPGKGVFVIKRTGKFKARAVICGNFVEKAGAENNYTEAVDATAVRLVLRLGALRDMIVCGTDVSTAFLNAELSGTDLERGILCRAPSIFSDAGATQRGEVWIIRKALYGLRQSPKQWGLHRDNFLTKTQNGGLGVWTDYAVPDQV